MQVQLELAIQMAYALGIGALIGLERTFEVAYERQQGDAADGSGDEAPRQEPEEKPEEEAPPSSSSPIGEQMGVRTFAVISLVGFSSTMVGDHVSAVPPVAFAAVTALVVALYFRSVHHGVGITTEVAALGACVLGMLCHYNHGVAAVLGLMITVLLASKRFAHTTVRKMRRVELVDTLKFLAVVLILLPLLPNRTLDPFGAFNPYKTGVLVVLVSGISFVGYFLTRILGARKGLGLTGIIGGLTSSTAVTAAMALQAKQKPELRSICAFSTIAANATMFVRVLLVVAVLDLALVKRLAWSIGAMSVVAVIATIWLWFSARQKKGQEETQVPLKNPFSIMPALKFAIFFVAILFVVKLAQRHLGDTGLYAASALSGLADVDAITLSITEQTKGAELARHVGAIAITIAVVSNSVTKTGIAIYTGGWAFGRLIALCLGAATVAGLVVALVV